LAFSFLLVTMPSWYSIQLKFNVFDRSSSLKQSRAVVHMGVYKTGSTTIQRLSAQLVEYLTKDEYEMPWALLSTAEQQKLLNMTASQVHFATCFIAPQSGPRLAYPCVPELLLSGLEVAKRNRNLFVSAETFALIEGNGLKLLSTYLSRWERTTIIVYYRRYYDWLLSAHNQMSKESKRGPPLDLVEFINSRLRDEKVSRSYTTSLVARLKEYFTDIVVVNFHDTETPLYETFYCDAMPKAYHTCQALHNLSSTQIVTNPSVPLVYKELVFGAMDLGLFYLDELANSNVESIIASTRDYHSHSLHANEDLLHRTCLSPESLQLLLNTSIQLELAVSSWTSSKTLPAIGTLTSDFDGKVNSGAFCKLNVNKTLAQTEWKSFFQSLPNISASTKALK